MIAVTEMLGSAVTGNLTVLAAVLVAYIAGLWTPGRYAGERLQGFGRAVASQIPYKPPPGKNEEEALQEATDADE